MSGGESRKAPLTVAFVIDSLDVGGTELNAVRLAEGLHARGVRVVVAHIQQEGPLRRRYEALGVPIRGFAWRGFVSWSFVRVGLALRRWLSAHGTTVVHAHDIYSNVFGAAWATGRDRKLVLSRRWWVMPYSRPLVAAYRLANWRADAVVANCHSLAAQVRLEQPGIAGRVISIPNYVEPDLLDTIPDGQRDILRLDLGIPPGAFVLGAVARLDPIKGHTTLIEALALLHGEFPQLWVALVGDGPMSAPLQDLARRLGVSSRVRFAGSRPSRPSPYHAFDVAVLTSYSEGFPNSLLEAAATGCPIVATGVGGVPDIVEDRVSGLHVPVRDPGALAASIRLLLTEPALAQRLAAAAREKVREQFLEPFVVQQWMALYERLASPIPG